LLVALILALPDGTTKPGITTTIQTGTKKSPSEEGPKIKNNQP